MKNWILNCLSEKIKKVQTCKNYEDGLDLLQFIKSLWNTEMKDEFEFRNSVMSKIVQFGLSPLSVEEKKLATLFACLVDCSKFPEFKNFSRVLSLQDEIK